MSVKTTFWEETGLYRVFGPNKQDLGAMTKDQIPKDFDYYATIYRNIHTNEQRLWVDCPVGAQHFTDHFSPDWTGPDGKTLVVKCPDGTDWIIDSQANNCTKKDDKIHRCWIRHGDPRQCNVTVDKNGNTCNAGGGSIQTSRYHGFLRNGEFVE